MVEDEVETRETVTTEATGSKSKPSDLTELGNAVSKLRIEGEGGPPFFKRKFRSVTSFSDYSLK